MAHWGSGEGVPPTEQNTSVGHTSQFVNSQCALAEQDAGIATQSEGEAGRWTRGQAQRGGFAAAAASHQRGKNGDWGWGKNGGWAHVDDMQRQNVGGAGGEAGEGGGK